MTIARGSEKATFNEDSLAIGKGFDYKMIVFVSGREPTLSDGITT